MNYPSESGFKAVRFQVPKKMDVGLEFAPLFDILLIALLFTLIGSCFITAPGFGINLSGGQAAGGHRSLLELPQTAPGKALSGVTVDESVSVLNIRGKAMIIFQGHIYSEDTFAQAMKDFKAKGTLLVKMDKSVDAQTFLRICQLAKESGFERAQIAAKPSEY